MLKVNNKDTRTTIFIVNFEHVIADWVATIHVWSLQNKKNIMFSLAN